MAGQEERSASPNPIVDFWIFQIIAVTVVVRMVVYSVDSAHYPLLPFLLLAAFLLLGLIQHLANLSSPRLVQAYLLVQSVIVFLLLVRPPYHDYYALLYIGLCLAVLRFLPLGPAVAWLGGMCILSLLGLVAAFGLREAIGYFPAYLGGILFVGLYGRANRHAEEARVRSEELSRRLEAANQRLRESAAHAEEVATTQERARLSRELHDAVTQTIFSMNLTAEAARTALATHPDRVSGLLERLQEMARDALAEMRSMVEQLRSPTVADSGLVESLKRYLALRERRDGLTAALTVRGEERGADALKDALLRTAQEALNNVARHSGVNEASIDLSFAENEVRLVIADKGKGFDPVGARPESCFGLHTMSERAEALGGRVKIDSRPGLGTRIEVAVPLPEEGE